MVWSDLFLQLKGTIIKYKFILFSPGLLKSPVSGLSKVFIGAIQGFPKIRAAILGIPIIGIIVVWGLY